MKTWEERMAGAAQAFGLTSEDFEQNFTASIGVTKEMGTSALDDDEILKFGDFRDAYKDRPIAVLRMAFKALREGRAAVEHTGSGTDPRLEQLKALGLKVRLEDADPSVLLPLYDPNKPSDPVTVVLKKRFGDQPIIAFHDDGTVAVTETLRNVADIEQGYPAGDAITVDGKLARLWPVGAKPNTLVEEDPLFSGKPLRNGYSTVNNRNWTDIKQASREMCRIIVERGEIDVNNKEAVLRLMERASGDNATKNPSNGLCTAYPEAELEYRERRVKNDLPKLKVELGKLSKPNNPFGVPRRY